MTLKEHPNPGFGFLVAAGGSRQLAGLALAALCFTGCGSSDSGDTPDHGIADSRMDTAAVRDLRQDSTTPQDQSSVPDHAPSDGRVVEDSQAPGDGAIPQDFGYTPCDPLQQNCVNGQEHCSYVENAGVYTGGCMPYGSKKEHEPCTIAPTTQIHDCKAGLYCTHLGVADGLTCASHCTKHSDCATGDVCYSVNASGAGLCRKPCDAFGTSCGTKTCGPTGGMADAGGLEWITVCQAAGARPKYEVCEKSDDCDAATTCFSWRCSTPCDDRHACPNATDKCAKLYTSVAQPKLKDLGICMERCEFFKASSCQPGYGCYAFNDYGGAYCYTLGTVQPGRTCRGSNECATDSLCYQTKCRTICDSTHPCGANEQCLMEAVVGDFGACVPK